MIFFARNQTDNSERLNKIEKSISRIDSELLNIATAQEVLREKILKKIRYKREDEEETKDLYNGMLLKER